MTRCRLYIDEVGNGGLTVASNNPNERYLSLTGIITKVHYYDCRFIPEINTFKREIFGVDGSNVILHRREIVRREGPFSVLRDNALSEEFDKRLLVLFERLPYLASTIVLDKKRHIDLYGDWTRDPYHYCLEALVERYVLWMRRNAYLGDVVIESRGKRPDKAVKAAFHGIYERGTQNIPYKIVQKFLTSKEIKFMLKTDNCPAMQIVDLIAHPSFRVCPETSRGIT
jgi:Protein of unknown function (DUF3800)